MYFALSSDVSLGIPSSLHMYSKWGNGFMCRTFYKIAFLEQLKIHFFRVRTLIEYCIFCTFSKILKRLRRGIWIDKRIWDDSPDRARRTTMTTMTITTMTIMTTTTTISRRRKTKPSRCRGGSGWREGVRPEGVA